MKFSVVSFAQLLLLLLLLDFARAAADCTVPKGDGECENGGVCQGPGRGCYCKDGFGGDKCVTALPAAPPAKEVSTADLLGVGGGNLDGVEASNINWLTTGLVGGGILICCGLCCWFLCCAGAKAAKDPETGKYRSPKELVRQATKQLSPRGHKHEAATALYTPGPTEMGAGGGSGTFSSAQMAAGGGGTATPGSSAGMLPGAPSGRYENVDRSSGSGYIHT